MNHGGRTSPINHTPSSSAVPRELLRASYIRLQTFRKPGGSVKTSLNQAENTFLENMIYQVEHRDKVSEHTLVGEQVHFPNSRLSPLKDRESSQQLESPIPVESPVAARIPGSQHRIATHHRPKRSAPLHEPSEPQNSAKPAKPHKAPAQNFTLDIQDKKVLLFYGREEIIDLTSPSKLSLNSKDTVSYRGGVIAVISGIAEAKRYAKIYQLAMYSGRKMTRATPKDKGVVLRGAAFAELYVSGSTAFYSRSKHFNALLSKRLEEVAANRNHAKILIEFRVFSSGKTLLTVNSTSIIVLTDAEFRSISERQTLLYANNTLHIQDRTQVGVVEVFPAIEQLLTLNNFGHGEGITKHSFSLARTLPGGGDLHVHKQTKTAFYSREPILNNKVQEFMLGLRPSLRSVVFSIRFESSSRGGQLEVVIAANGNDILRLKPHRVIDQSVATQHHMTYANSTVYVMDGEEILDAIENIKEIRLHNEDQLNLYTTESAERIPGGGQLFTCQGLGLYSVDADLNDRIGDALLGAETQPPMPPFSPSASCEGAKGTSACPKDAVSTP